MPYNLLLKMSFLREISSRGFKELALEIFQRISRNQDSLGAVIGLRSG